MMDEPTLNSIEDYNTLKGEKKRIVWAVIFAGLLIGIIYLIAANIYNNKEDSIHLDDPITAVPTSKSIPVK